jgi:hypothetical protein
MALVAAVGLMAGCAGGAFSNSPAPTKDTFLKYAGPPIDRFTYLGHDEGFRTLGGEDVVIWTTISDAYLITVMKPCVQLPFANRVALTSASKTVTSNVDWVLVDNDRCRIASIRHIDYGAMKAAGIAPP